MDIKELLRNIVLMAFALLLLNISIALLEKQTVIISLITGAILGSIGTFLNYMGSKKKG